MRIFHYTKGDEYVAFIVFEIPIFFSTIETVVDQLDLD